MGTVICFHSIKCKYALFHYRLIPKITTSRKKEKSIRYLYIHVSKIQSWCIFLFEKKKKKYRNFWWTMIIWKKKQFLFIYLLTFPKLKKEYLQSPKKYKFSDFSDKKKISKLVIANNKTEVICKKRKKNKFSKFSARGFCNNVIMHIRAAYTKKILTRLRSTPTN